MKIFHFRSDESYPDSGLFPIIKDCPSYDSILNLCDNLLFVDYNPRDIRASIEKSELPYESRNHQQLDETKRHVLTCKDECFGYAERYIRDYLMSRPSPNSDSNSRLNLLALLFKNPLIPLKSLRKR